MLAAEKSAGGNTKYLLDSQTLYEINGAVNLDLPIELNNAYITGLDSGEDKLIKSGGDLFTGSTGGTVKVLTLVASGGGGKVFNLNGSGSSNLVFRDCIVANSTAVGTIKGFSLVFLSVIQYSNNTNGVVYEDISKLLINNAGWFGDNNGVYEKLQGTFGLFQKDGGFTEVNGAAIGFDVSANPVITREAVLETVVFEGVLTTGKYVNGYTVGSYPGYNFNNSWYVRADGIRDESDDNAHGEISIDYPVGSGAPTSFNGGTPSNIVKVQGESTSSDLLRFQEVAERKMITKLSISGKEKEFFIFQGRFHFKFLR